MNFSLLRSVRAWEASSDLYCMCDKVHGAGSAASAKAQLVWIIAYKVKAGIL